MPWPKDIVSGHFWYWQTHHSPGRLPKWLELLQSELKGVADNDNDNKEVERDSPDPEGTAHPGSVPIQPETGGDTSAPSESMGSKTERYLLWSRIQPPGRFM